MDPFFRASQSRASLSLVVSSLFCGSRLPFVSAHTPSLPHPAFVYPRNNPLPQCSLWCTLLSATPHYRSSHIPSPKQKTPLLQMSMMIYHLSPTLSPHTSRRYRNSSNRRYPTPAFPTKDMQFRNPAKPGHAANPSSYSLSSHSRTRSSTNLVSLLSLIRSCSCLCLRLFIAVTACVRIRLRVRLGLVPTCFDASICLCRFFVPAHRYLHGQHH